MSKLSQQGKLALVCVAARVQKQPLTRCFLTWGCHQENVPVLSSKWMLASVPLPPSLWCPVGFLYHLTLEQELKKGKSGIILCCCISLAELRAPSAYALLWDSGQEQPCSDVWGGGRELYFLVFFSSSFDLLRKVPNDLVMSWVIRCMFHLETCIPTGG